MVLRAGCQTEFHIETPNRKVRDSKVGRNLYMVLRVGCRRGMSMLVIWLKAVSVWVKANPSLPWLVYGPSSRMSTGNVIIIIASLGLVVCEADEMRFSLIHSFYSA